MKGYFILMMYRNGQGSLRSDWYSDYFTDAESVVEYFFDNEEYLKNYPGLYRDVVMHKIPDNEYGRDLCNDIIRDYAETGWSDLAPVIDMVENR
jgi:hypothetical protein